MTETKKATRPTGLFSLCERLVQSGTLKDDLAPIYDLLPKDRYGHWTGKDVPVSAAIDKMEQIVEEDDANVENDVTMVRRLSPLTLAKAKSIAKKGSWTLPFKYTPKLENPLPDEEVDPDEVEDDDDELAVKTPKKRGRKPKAAPETVPA
jgi:hypothetical protein